MPGVVRTYAPLGQTPVLPALLSKEHLSVISALTADGRLYYALQERPYTGEDIVEFLKVLHRRLKGKVLIIWDGAPIHQASPVKAYLAGGAARYFQLERLPGYAPDLNPDEGVWQLLKHTFLGNVCCRTIEQLSECLKVAVRRLRYQRQVLKDCIAAYGFAL